MTSGATQRIETKLGSLSLAEPASAGTSPASSAPIDCGKPGTNTKAAFRELLAVSPTHLVNLAGADPEQETQMWDCFAEVYAREILARQSGVDTELTTDDKRQILADILVWAEVTQPHYDPTTQTFVTAPHDDSFQRIGAALRAAKAERGLQ